MQIIIGGIVTEYCDEGKGPVVLFLHGWQSDARSFDKVAAQLVRNWRVVRLDLPGFGLSEPVPPFWGVSHYVAHVAEFVRKLQLDVYCIIGHSFGGRLAIKGVATHALHAACLVLIASAGVARRDGAILRMTALITKVGSLLFYVPPLLFWRKSIRRGLYARLGSNYLHAGDMKGVFLRVINEDLSAYATQVRCPVLLVWGDQDNTTPLSEGLFLLEKMPRARLCRMPNAGHFVHEEKWEKVADYINDFLYEHHA